MDHIPCVFCGAPSLPTFDQPVCLEHLGDMASYGLHWALTGECYLCMGDGRVPGCVICSAWRAPAPQSLEEALCCVVLEAA